ncbi:rod shape-determining protein MreC [Candidatus Parcubacteria bacterium]|jgi:rod shape-determining protein MreC|nr:rod shape-determining protein MreC [Candidatus Parcubacteria bacterium]
MLKDNLRIFFLFIVVVFLFILFKNGQIFDLGFIFRNTIYTNKTVNSLLDPSPELQEQYKDLLVENNKLKNLEEENNQLKELLNFKKEKQYNLVVANIINRDPVNRNILIINSGLGQNIAVGQAVVVNNGIIVGKVIDTSVDSAKVRLLTDNFSKLAVKVGDDRRVSGVLSGSLGLGMDLSYIPQEQEIKKNDLVVSSDIDDLIPAGLVVGKIESTNFSQEELFKNAAVSPLIDYNTLGFVAVITSL